MAWVEKRTQGQLTSWRVVCEQAGRPGWQQETFGTESAARDFHALVQASHNRWPHGWIGASDSPLPARQTHHGFVTTPRRRSLHDRAPTNAPVRTTARCCATMSTRSSGTCPSTASTASASPRSPSGWSTSDAQQRPSPMSTACCRRSSRTP
jgi:hypothetical protein